MLCACRDVIRAYMIRVVALHTMYLCHSHLRIHICVLAEAFPHTRPSRISSKVHCRRECPRHICRTAFISRNLTHIVRMLTVECGSNVDLLREKHAAEHICGAVDMVKSIKAWDAHLLHRDTVQLLDEAVIVFRPLSDVARSIEDRSHLVCPDDRITGCSKVDSICDRCYCNLSHLADLLLESHLLEDLFDLGLDLLVLRNCRSHLRRCAARCKSQRCSSKHEKSVQFHNYAV